MTPHRRLALAAALASFSTPLALAQTTIEVPAVADATIYEAIPDAPELGNGAGDFLFAGRTASEKLRRSLLRFDLSAIPSDAAIVEVRCHLTLSLTITGPKVVALHRATAPWTEGDSDAPGNEGGGTDALRGDVTWTFSTLPSVPWANPGGDFSPTPSASTQVESAATYEWTSTALADDVRAWLADPASNFGWFVLGDETPGTSSAKRFNSRTNPDEATRPSLQITFLAGPSCDPDLNQDGNSDQDDVAYLINVIGGGDNPTGIDPDFNHDGNADQDDVAALINAIGGGGCP